MKPAEVAALLGRFGFSVDSDEAIPAVAARLSADLAARTRLMEHLRIVAASR